MSEAIGFLGLGHLGLPMATNLVDAGFAVRVYNRTESKAAPLAARGVTVAAKPLDVVTARGVVASVLWDDAAVESVATPEFIDRLGPGGLHISMSTLLPDAARRIASAHERRGCSYVEAPVFGRPEAAAARQLWIPVAGSRDAKARAKPFLEAMGAQGIFDFGDTIGAANTVKLAGNFLIIAAARSLGEAVAMAGKNGVEPRAFVEMMTSTLFNAPIYQGYGKRLVEGALPMKGGIPLKDVGLFEQAASEAGVTTPLAASLIELLR
jgi:3-hydroxyisobutyrate dehydrogenase-like beta-hydroxyacid dehydrogenase